MSERINQDLVILKHGRLAAGLSFRREGRATRAMIRERDEAYYSEPLSLGQLLLGDPPHGRSALEKRNG